MRASRATRARKRRRERLVLLLRHGRGGAARSKSHADLANANVGGENVHRGAILGAILGAYAGDEQLSKEMKDGLYEKEAIEKEIDDFVRSVMKSGASSEDCTASSKQCSEPV